MHSAMKQKFRQIISAAHQPTQILDKPFLRRNLSVPWPPIFILGAPRSGTTLLYQMLVHRFEFSYFPNIANYFYMCPIFATRIGLEIFPPYVSSFKSNFGYEEGWMSPSEAGNIWNRWFPHEKREGYNYTAEGFLSEGERGEIKSIVANVCMIYRRPFLSKNVKIDVRLRAMKEIFPNALFLHISRDFVDSAVSLLVKRRRDKREWISVMPRDINNIKNKSDMEQVAAQIYFVEQDIRRDIKIFGKNNYMKLEYKQLCEKPEQLMSDIFDFLKSGKIALNEKHKRPFASFPVSRHVKSKYVSDAEIDKIGKILSALIKTGTVA
jgi:hypothetical protein